ncbi:hypothetical protein NLI96_g2237 [Meripilus lineatus]|uniref:Uncharacterized protein n=1 Tax=Meripilus lineatus TaxID=2056292 RepID=A0AAD5V8S0_9APHY|nr:hypothetical protein NLI96_g2237 [Physisporinus lineatus]
MSNVEKGSIGTVEAVPPQQALAGEVVQKKPFANPTPIGLFAFSATTLILSLYNANAEGIHVGNVVVGMCIFVGGIVQFFAGMWEVVVGNTFASTVFSLFGGFWMSYGIIFIPGAGILDAYEKVPDQLTGALGIYLIVWFLIVTILMMATLRVNIAFISLFFFLDLTFLFLALSQFTGNVNLAKAGGYTGSICSCIGLYSGAALVINKENSFFTLPLGAISS